MGGPDPPGQPAVHDGVKAINPSNGPVNSPFLSKVTDYLFTVIDK